MMRRTLIAVTTGALLASSTLPVAGDELAKPPAKPSSIATAASETEESDVSGLSDVELSALPRRADDPACKTLYREIARRPHIAPEARSEALEALAAFNASSFVEELGKVAAAAPTPLEAIGGALLLQARPPAELQEKQALLAEWSQAADPRLQLVGMTGLLALREFDQIRSSVEKEPASLESLLLSISRIGNEKLVQEFRPTMIEAVESESASATARIVALYALALNMPNFERQANLEIVAKAYRSLALRDAAVGALVLVPSEERPKAAMDALAEQMVADVEATPPLERTRHELLQLQELAEQTLASLAGPEAESLKARLKRVRNHHGRITALRDEHRYDKPIFVAEAGRPYHIMFDNADLLPHNVVITAPGAAHEVAMLAAAMPHEYAPDEKPYVPASDKVIASSQLHSSMDELEMTFVAPATPGEYPYISTYPGQWLRMNGTLIVVENLEEWSGDPQPPPDPLKGFRPIVKNWKVEDFSGDLESLVAKRDLAVGKQLFQGASCAACHGVDGRGNAAIPDLRATARRWKSDAPGVMRDILDPSGEIDEVHRLAGVSCHDGIRVGMALKRRDGKIELSSNPANPKPMTINEANAIEIEYAKASMMPPGLLDRFTRDEIGTLLAYLISLED